MSIKSLDIPAEQAAVYDKGHVLVAECPSRAVLQHVTSRWGLLVLLVLQKRTHRFSELRRSIGGVSEKMLAQSLQALENDGFVLRHSYDEVPPRVDYTLTATGVEVAQHLAALTDWIEGNMSRIGQSGEVG
ncbi:winged helix-turn-helix transcriptional regulator [Undibacterium sp. TC4M20W]|uniref:winged helix-turn-helix transcriptional regulator n=1 Tax=Undibacterium sp. TC4M20W TaxID=3413052 RepID=UPI003BF1B38E